MPNWSDPRDDDDCGCTMGHSCRYHRAEAEREEQSTRQRLIGKGINPDAQVSGEIVGILLSVDCCDELSQNQKDAIHRIIFPYKR